MSTLTGTKPKNTYKDLLQVSNSNSGIDGTLRTVSDGEATNSVLQLSTSAVNIDSATGLQLNGTTALTGGILKHEVGGLEADVSAYSGLIKIDSGTTSNLTLGAAAEGFISNGASTATARTYLGLGTAAIADTGADATAELPANSAWTTKTDNTGTYSVIIGDNHKIVIIGGGSPTVTLPEGSTLFGGFEVIVKSNSGSTVTINRSGSDTIDGGTSLTLPNQYDWVWLRNNGGTNWWIASRGALAGAATATAAGIVEKATQAEMEAETADKYPDASLVKHSPGVAKAWVKIDMAATKLDSYGVSSVDDDATGNFGVNWSTAFANANYAFWTTGLYGGTLGGEIIATSQLAASLNGIGFVTTGGSRSETNVTAICVGAMGDT